MHNRTAAFDSIVNEMESHASAANPPQSGGPGHSGVIMNRMFSKSSIVRTGVSPEGTRSLGYALLLDVELIYSNTSLSTILRRS